MSNNWGAQIPVYVTRKNADGFVGTYSFAAWLVVLVQFLVSINIVLWGAAGVYAAVRSFS